MKKFTINPFLVEEELPKSVKVILREQIRDVVSYRNEYSGFTLTNGSLDNFIDQWWSRKWRQIKCASQYPEWNWNALALIRDKSVIRPVDFNSAYYDFEMFVSRANNTYAKPYKKTDGPVSYQCASTDHKLKEMMLELFNEVIREGAKHKRGDKRNTPYIKLKKSEEFAEHLRNNPLVYQNDEGKYIDKFEEVFGSRFNRLPETYYNEFIENKKTSSEIRIEFSDLLNDSDNYILFKNAFLKHLNVDRVNSGTGFGQDKTTVLNKMITHYFKMVTALSYGTIYNIPTPAHQTFKEAFDFFKSNDRLLYYSYKEFKIRLSSGGFRTTHLINYEQMFAHLMELVNGSIADENFVVSFHPCDLITCSFGYNWSSCMSFIDIFGDFPEKYGSSGNGTSSYSGAYHIGNFQIAVGNGITAYIPDVIKEPLYYVAKKKRILMWVNDDMTAITQNCFYPGRATDTESSALAKTIRIYLQNIFSLANGSSGTADWKTVSSNTDVPYSEVRRGRFFGYADPVFKRSYLTTQENHTSIVYNDTFPYLNTRTEYLGDPDSPYSIIRSSKILNFNVESGHLCRVCGLQTPGSDDVYCTGHASEVIPCDNCGKELCADDLIKISGKTYCVDCYESKHESFRFCNDTLNSEEIYVLVNTDAGVSYYHDKKHKDIAKCNVCKNYFTKNLMVGNTCIEHSIERDVVYFKDILSNLNDGTLAIKFEDSLVLERVLRFFKLENVKWKSGKAADEFLPTDNSKVLSVSSGCLVLKSPLIISRNIQFVDADKILYEKGGEVDDQ